MNYSIIKDEEKLREFIKWLPELKINECYYFCLFARSKYAKNEDGSNKFPHIKTDKSQLRRFIATDKSKIFTKIKQLEVEIGAYKTKDGEDIPQEALALYVLPNPRCQKKASFFLSRRLLDILQMNNEGFTLDHEAWSAIQKSRSRKIFHDMDFDDITINESIEAINEAINEESRIFIQTRGGFHLLIELSKVDNVFKDTWYNRLLKINPDIKGDNMIPVPGCTQGNFIPYFI